MMDFKAKLISQETLPKLFLCLKTKRGKKFLKKKWKKYFLKNLLFIERKKNTQVKIESEEITKFLEKLFFS